MHIFPVHFSSHKSVTSEKKKKHRSVGMMVPELYSSWRFRNSNQHGDIRSCTATQRASQSDRKRKTNGTILCHFTSITIVVSVVSCKADIYLWNMILSINTESGKRHQVIKFCIMTFSDLLINFDMCLKSNLYHIFPSCVQDYYFRLWEMGYTESLQYTFI